MGARLGVPRIVLFDEKWEIGAVSVRRPDLGECWIWTAYTTPDGYGKFGTGDRRCVGAHRWAYEYHVGPIASCLEIDHLCEVRNCVRPTHLEAVTHRVNVLRGSRTHAGANARKTACKRGHPLTEANTYHQPNSNHRACRTCVRQRQQRNKETK